MLMLSNLGAARMLGWALFKSAGIAIGAGWYLGRRLDRANRVFERAGVDQEVTIAKLYPDWPTWWIPESAERFAAWLFVGAVGAWLAYTAKSLHRQLS